MIIKNNKNITKNKIYCTIFPAVLLNTTDTWGRPESRAAEKL